jgi:hypothetical protein
MLGKDESPRWHIFLVVWMLCCSTPRCGLSLYTCLCVCPVRSVRPSVHPSVRLSVCLPVWVRHETASSRFPFLEQSFVDIMPAGPAHLPNWTSVAVRSAPRSSSVSVAWTCPLSAAHIKAVRPSLQRRSSRMDRQTQKLASFFSIESGSWPHIPESYKTPQQGGCTCLTACHSSPVWQSHPPSLNPQGNEHAISTGIPIPERTTVVTKQQDNTRFTGYSIGNIYTLRLPNHAHLSCWLMSKSRLRSTIRAISLCIPRSAASWMLAGGLSTPAGTSTASQHEAENVR